MADLRTVRSSKFIRQESILKAIGLADVQKSFNGPARTGSFAMPRMSVPSPQRKLHHLLTPRIMKKPAFRCLAVLCIFTAMNTLPARSAADSLNLAGEWRFALDPKDEGVKAGWAATDLPGKIRLPGSLQDQGLGLPVTVDTPWTANVQDRSFWTDPKHERDRKEGDIRMPCWLTPTNHYVGAAWYQRTIEIPENWKGRRVTIHLERVHWSSRLWIDGVEVPSVGGTAESLAVPHVYDLGTGVKPGRHTITLRVDNRMLVDVGNWAHSVSDHTQGNWNGVIGEMMVKATSPVVLDDVQVYPDQKAGTARVTATVRHDPGAAGKGTLRVGDAEVAVAWPSEKPFELTVPLPSGANLWDEFEPALQTLKVTLKGDQADDAREVTFGLRELTVADDRDFVLNGRPVLMRGNLECAIFPETGYPPMDEAAWTRIYGILRAHGLNHLRFHSWTPPRAAFVAADKMGFYLQIEMGAWTGVGKGHPQDAWLYREAAQVLREFGNHPSFLLMAYGNEPLPYSHDDDRNRWLSKWVAHWREKDPRRFQTSAGFYPQLPENQFHITLADRGPSRWPSNLLRTDKRVPVIVHEMGQYCVYPDFNEIARYTGHLKARNFEIFRDSAEANGVLPLAEEFLQASGKLQVLCYKEDIESALRTPGIGGFQLLDLHDFPGQGTALVGVLNAFWEEKGYVTPEQYRRFAGITVPLIRAPRVVEASGTLEIPVDLAHYGAAPTPETAPVWTLKDASGKTLHEGKLPAASFRVGRSLNIGQITLPIGELPAPANYTLEIVLPGTTAANDWPLTVFPKKVPAEAAKGVTLATTLTPDLAERAAAGETIVIAHPWLGKDGPVGSFTPVFWNRQWFGSQATRTLGILCDPKHPALAEFPSESHTTWAWKDILDRSRCLELSHNDLAPVVRWIDDWNTNQPLALIAETRVGKGRVLLCAADLGKDLAERPAARQLRQSLLAYAASPAFAPKAEMTKERLAELTTMPANMRLGATVTASSETEKFPAANVIDGNPGTFWHTPWTDNPPGYPHELTLSLPSPARLNGVKLHPRRDMDNGRPSKVSVYTTTDTSTWRPVATAEMWADNVATITFPAETVSGVRIVLEAPQKPGEVFATMAEVDLIEER